MKIGIDIGGVIIDRSNDAEDTSLFGDNYLNAKPLDGAFASIKELAGVPTEIHLVSKCGERVQKRSLEWLKHNDFYGMTGVLPERVHFCRERHEKRGICEELKLDVMIDDRLEVLSYLVDVVGKLICFKPSLSEVSRFWGKVPRVVLVSGWRDVVDELRRYSP